MNSRIATVSFTPSFSLSPALVADEKTGLFLIDAAFDGSCPFFHLFSDQLKHHEHHSHP